MGVIRRIKKIVIGRNPGNNTSDNLGETGEIHNLFDQDGLHPGAGGIQPSRKARGASPNYSDIIDLRHIWSPPGIKPGAPFCCCDIPPRLSSV